MCTCLRLNLEVSLSKKERPRPPPLPRLIDDSSLASGGTVNVPVLAGGGLVLRSFTVLPEIVVRYAMPRLKFMLLLVATAGDVGERAETPVLAGSFSDGLHTHTHNDYINTALPCIHKSLKGLHLTPLNSQPLKIILVLESA